MTVYTVKFFNPSLYHHSLPKIPCYREVKMAGLDRFTSGPDHYWSDQKYVEGDPRRPVNISLEAGQSDLGKRKLGEREEAEVGEKETDKYAGIGIGLSGLLAENIVCHPFTILRRQCQVNVEARRYHTTPITLLPVLVNLNRWQGGSVLWKGKQLSGTELIYVNFQGKNTKL